MEFLQKSSKFATSWLSPLKHDLQATGFKLGCITSVQKFVSLREIIRKRCQVSSMGIIYGIKRDDVTVK
jgi:hypothetical protein